MPNPKRRHSKARRDKRRANWKLPVLNITLCSNCKKPKLPHIICPSCGYYDGELLLPPRVKKKKEEGKQA